MTRFDGNYMLAFIISDKTFLFLSNPKIYTCNSRRIKEHPTTELFFFQLKNEGQYNIADL